MEIRLVTAALPYVNNVPHIGHLVGSHLPADIFARYNRLKRNIVVFIGGTDEHGTPTELTAIKYNTTPEKVTDVFHKIHKSIYEWFEISYDNFSRTSKSKIHYIVTQEMFLQIFKNKYIVEKEQELAYDPQWKRFLPDRYVEGVCPYCGYEKARGDQCEKCGRLLDPKDLINPRNAITGNPVEFRKTRHLFIDLSRLEDKLRAWLEGKKTIFTDQAISMAFSWMSEGLKPRSITRDLKWGVPVPYNELWEIIKSEVLQNSYSSKEDFVSKMIEILKSYGMLVSEDEVNKLYKIVEEFWPDLNKILSTYNYFEIYKDKVFYVWFDAPIGYLSFTIELLPEEIVESTEDPNMKVEIEGNITKLYINSSYIGNVKFHYDDTALYIDEIKISKYKYLKTLIKILLKKFGKQKAVIKINWKTFWTNPSSNIYHFIGKDNIPFHTIFWPGMILAFNDSKEFIGNKLKFPINLPYNVIGLNYLNYEGRKISKSQNWGVFCDSIPESGLEPDYWRFYLSLLIPENKDTDFVWREFQEVINKELVNNIGNLLHRVLSFTWKNYRGILDENPDKEVLNTIVNYKKDIERLFEEVKLVQALRKILEFSHRGNQLFQERKPWEDKEKSKPFMKAMLYYVRALLIFLYPFIPKKSIEGLSFLGIDNPNWSMIEDFGDISVVKEPKPLFRKLDEKMIEEIKSKVTKPKDYTNLLIN